MDHSAAQAVDPSLFTYLRMVLSMVVSLGMARLLSGAARIVQHPGRTPLYWVHLLWGVSMLLTLAADVLDTAIKGGAYLQAQGTEYLVRVAVYVVLCGAAAFVRSARFHAMFAVGNLVYQMSWILRIYDVLE